MVITKCADAVLVIQQASPTPARRRPPAKTAGGRHDWTAPPPRTLPTAAQNEPPTTRAREGTWGGWARRNRSSAKARWKRLLLRPGLTPHGISKRETAASKTPPGWCGWVLLRCVLYSKAVFAHRPLKVAGLRFLPFSDSSFFRRVYE